jgi:hypothetical protein
MATTPEGKVKNAVKKLLKAHGAYWHMPVQNGMGAPSLDFIGCHRGSYYGIETKAGDKKPTPRQEHTMNEIRQAGGLAFLVNEVSGMDDLLSWLTRK